MSTTEQPATAAPAPAVVDAVPTPKLVVPDNSIIMIAGFAKCRNYVRAVETFNLLEKAHPGVLRVAKFESDREGYHAMRPQLLAQLNMGPDDHKTSPLIYILDKETMKAAEKGYIGGGSDFCDIVKVQYGVEPAVLGPKLE